VAESVSDNTIVESWFSLVTLSVNPRLRQVVLPADQLVAVLLDVTQNDGAQAAV
jgi:hypothetical protein